VKKRNVRAIFLLIFLYYAIFFQVTVNIQKIPLEGEQVLYSLHSVDSISLRQNKKSPIIGEILLYEYSLEVVLKDLCRPEKLQST
jgi:hypothetical protein